MKKSKAPSGRTRPRVVRPPKLKANLLKILQYLLSAASYATVLESGQIRENRMTDCIDKCD